MSYMAYVPQVAPTTGTPHYQYYIQTKKWLNSDQVEKLRTQFGYKFIERQRGTVQDCMDYLEKDVKGTNTGPVVERGTRDPSITGDRRQGNGMTAERKEHALMKVREDIMAGMPEDELDRKHTHWMNASGKLVEKWTAQRDSKTRYEPVEPIWDKRSQHIWDYCMAPSNKRSVLFCTGPSGTGKSTVMQDICNKLGEMNRTVYSGPLDGNARDMVELHQQQDFFIVDIPMDTNIKDVPWKIFEQHMNGEIKSTKYKTRKILIKDPHVVIFTNFTVAELLNLRGLAKERVGIIDMEDPQWRRTVTAPTLPPLPPTEI